MKIKLFLFITLISICDLVFAEDIVIFPAKDTFLRNAAPNTNEGANPLLSVRHVGRRASLLAFDLSSVAAAGQSRVFKSAKLRLYVKENLENWGKAGRTVSLFSVRQDWIEGNGSNAKPRRAEDNSNEDLNHLRTKAQEQGLPGIAPLI